MQKTKNTMPRWSKKRSKFSSTRGSLAIKFLTTFLVSEFIHLFEWFLMKRSKTMKR